MYDTVCFLSPLIIFFFSVFFVELYIFSVERMFVLFEKKMGLRGAVVMRTSIRVLSLPLRDGLHGCRVEPAAGAVAAAVGSGRDAGAALSGGGRHREGLG